MRAINSLYAKLLLMIINLFELKRNIFNVQLNQNDSYLLLSYPLLRLELKRK